MIPDGMREMATTKPSLAVEDSNKTETSASTERTENGVQSTEAKAGVNAEQNTEPGRKETAQEAQEDVNQQPCLANSEVPHSSKVATSEHNNNSSRKVDDADLSDLIKDDEMKPALQDAENGEVSEGDSQPVSSEHVKKETEGNDSHATTGSDTNRDTASEPAEQDAMNSTEQQTAEDGDKGNGRKKSSEEADKGIMESNEYIIEESTCDIQSAECETEENRLEDRPKSGASIRRETTEATENGKELVTNEDSEQLSECVPDQTGELQQSVNESTAEAGTHTESSQLGGNNSTAEISSEADKTDVQPLTESTDPAPEPTNENPEQQLVMNSETVEQHATEETADSTDVRSRSAEPATESTEEQHPDTSTKKDEGHVIDSIQSANSQPKETTKCVEQDEQVSMHQSNCENVAEEHMTDANETANEQLEQQAETTTNTERDEVQVIAVEDGAVRLTAVSEASNSELLKKVESPHQSEDHKNEKEDDSIEKMAAVDDSTEELQGGTERTMDKQTDGSDTNKLDESIEETNANQPLHTEEVRSSSDLKTTEQRDDNGPEYCYDEPDKTVKWITKESYEACEPKDVGGKVRAQEHSHNDREAQEEVGNNEEDVQGQESKGHETSPAQASVEERKENETSEMITEESAEAQHLVEISTAEETTATSESVDNPENRDSTDNEEQQNKQQTEQSEPTPGNSGERNEDFVTVKELVTDTSKEQVSAATNQPHEVLTDQRTSESVENPFESETVMDKSSNIPDAENPNEHHETTKFEEDFSEPSEDHPLSTAVEACSSNSIEVNDAQNIQPVADSVEATKEQLMDKPTTGEEKALLSVLDSNTEEKHDENVASEHSHVDETAKDCQPDEDVKDSEVNEKHNTSATTEREGAEQSSTDQHDTTGTGTVERQTESTQSSAEDSVTCDGTSESNDNTVSPSDDAFDVKETDEVPQEDANINDRSQVEEVSNHQTDELDPGTSQLNSEHDSRVSTEKSESIRPYVDGCRDIELSGMKLAPDHVSCKIALIAFCCVFTLKQRQYNVHFNLVVTFSYAGSTSVQTAMQHINLCVPPSVRTCLVGPARQAPAAAMASCIVAQMQLNVLLA